MGNKVSYVKSSDTYKIGDIVFHLGKNNMVEYVIENIHYIQSDPLDPIYDVSGNLNFYRYLIVVKDLKFGRLLPDPYNARCWASTEEIISAKEYYREKKLNELIG